MAEHFESESDQYLEQMRSSRKGPAVLKLLLANIRSEAPSELIFAFEGNDDKTVYFHWVRRIRSDLKYLPFPCDGKEQVLQLREMIDRDRGSIGDAVYFFVDRDFDDLRGRLPSPKMFMTDAYSIENYLVTKEVLDELLKNEFHCNVNIAICRDLCGLFSETYRKFLEMTNDANRRLFAARKLKIPLSSPLPDKVNRLAKVSATEVFAADYAVHEVVKTEREPSEHELASIMVEFDELNKETRYRGKFALLFFMKWLEELALDRNAENSVFFAQKDAKLKVRFQNITLDSLAAKAPLPAGFAEFIQGVQVIH